MIADPPRAGSRMSLWIHGLSSLPEPFLSTWPWPLRVRLLTAEALCCPVPQGLAQMPSPFPGFSHCLSSLPHSSQHFVERVSVPLTPLCSEAFGSSASHSGGHGLLAYRGGAVNCSMSCTWKVVGASLMFDGQINQVAGLP